MTYPFRIVLGRQISDCLSDACAPGRAEYQSSSHVSSAINILSRLIARSNSELPPKAKGDLVWGAWIAPASIHWSEHLPVVVRPTLLDRSPSRWSPWLRASGCRPQGWGVHQHPYNLLFSKLWSQGRYILWLDSAMASGCITTNCGSATRNRYLSYKSSKHHATRVGKSKFESKCNIHFKAAKIIFAR